jgi:hypothetical protein
LAVDAKHRFDGVVGDLHTLASLKQQAWDFRLPTICRAWRTYGQQKSNNFSMETNLQKVIDALYTRAPVLKGVDMTNVLLAGGAVSSVMVDRRGFGDLDLFIYGLSEAAASARVEKLVADLFKSAESIAIEKEKERFARNPKTKHKQVTKATFPFNMVRTQHTLTFTVLGSTFQIIFRLYKTISEILHGFDFGACAVGFDGTQIWTTTLGKFAYEYGCNIVDPSRRSTTYESRLNKYMKRGFDLVLPGLDMTLVRTEYCQYGYSEMIILPFMRIAYNTVHGFRVLAKDIQIKSLAASDYEEMDLENTFKLLEVNISRLAHGKDKTLFHTMDMDSANADDAKRVLAELPYLSRRQIIEFYDHLPSAVFSGGKLNYHRLFKTVACASESKLAAELFAFPTRDERVQFIRDVCQQQKNTSLAIWDSIESTDFASVKWITQSPGRQFTSSFNPVLSNAEDWYGEYFKGNKSVAADSSSSDEAVLISAEAVPTTTSTNQAF